MAEETLGEAGLKDKIGVEWESGPYEIEKGAIRRFARALGDTNPLWQDEEYAGKSSFGGIIAPPTFVLAIGLEQFMEEVVSLASFGTILNGGTELECYQPVRAGDRITVITKIANVREREGKMGKTAFINFDTTYKNQKQELVAHCRQMIIGY
jgi:acyl dehydratase